MEDADLMYRHAFLERSDHLADDAACLAGRIGGEQEPLRLRFCVRLLDLLEGRCGGAESFKQARAGRGQGARRRDVDRPKIAQGARAACLYSAGSGVEQVLLVVESRRRLAKEIIEAKYLSGVIRVVAPDVGRRCDPGSAQAAEELPQNARVPRQVAHCRQGPLRLARHLSGEIVADGAGERPTAVRGQVARAEELRQPRERLEADGRKRR